MRRAPAPVRHGVHANTAFALTLLHDGAAVRGDDRLAALVRDRAIGWYRDDRDYPIDWEPSGQDFVSPALTEADLMRRVLPETEFPAWLGEFLPRLGSAATSPAAGGTRASNGLRVVAPGGPGTGWGLRAVAPADPGDGQQSHLYGLGLCRAWQLRALATALPPDDPRATSFRTLAEVEIDRCIGALTGTDFLTQHWLASFAYLALSADPRTVVPGTV